MKIGAGGFRDDGDPTSHLATHIDRQHYEKIGEYPYHSMKADTVDTIVSIVSKED
jgi:hypothetical protein